MKEQDIKALLDTYPKTQSDAEIIAGYEKAIKEFEELVKKGVAKHRGYTLWALQAKYTPLK